MVRGAVQPASAKNVACTNDWMPGKVHLIHRCEDANLRGLRASVKKYSLREIELSSHDLHIFAQ